jgi:hypothetical protein
LIETVRFIDSDPFKETKVEKGQELGLQINKDPLEIAGFGLLADDLWNFPLVVNFTNIL